MSETHPGQVALGLAAACAMLMAVVAIFDPRQAWLLPVPAFGVASLFYWLGAIGAAGFSVAALWRRQWAWALGALATIAVTLIPSGALVYECARGNCL
ncbi:hypothetical protein [Sphingomonas sp. G-3-2-10]|uniref:hypothetical protein n=1 Tax=Sphingomonas sp. G-3-2-10 TaxID=2728838 RepID=UPI00146C442E|nr:hypothetical protein [Sphingomonas sp. G-3-2-10]NML07271.1 hypothetical protein [Sphingomonas sp. G-3-2-10]